ncbi:hypothetical protein ACET3Z_030625 [Daucus carota]
MADWTGPATRLLNRYYLFHTNVHVAAAIFNVLYWIAILIILNFVRISVQIVIIYLASFLPGGARSWKATWAVGVAIFATSYYCMKACVETKRAQVPEQIPDPPTRKNK